jgi:gluconolactonase
MLELVTDKLRFPEGPIAMADGSVIVVEMRGEALSRVFPDGRIEVICEVPGGPNGAAVGPDGAVYVCNNGGSFDWVQRPDGVWMAGKLKEENRGCIQRVDLATRKLTTIYTNCDGEPFMSPNDLVFDSTGGFWFSDHGRTTKLGRHFGGLYYAKADGTKVVRVRDHLISPNGVGLSPDEKTLYLADTYLQRVYAMPLTGPGQAEPFVGRGAGPILATLPDYQALDSMAVEASGDVCVGTLANGGITTFHLDGTTEHFPVDDPFVTNICFGGADMRDAWITASLGDKLFKTRWPRPGLKLAFNA